MRRASPARWIGALALLAAVAMPVFAQEAGREAAADPLVYRRIYVPEEDLPTQARGLLPIKRDDFQKRMEAAARNRSGRTPSRFRIDRGVYRANFRNGQLVGGTAELDVQCPPNERGYVELGEVNLAISAPQWDGDPPHSALLGLSDAGKYVLQAKGPGQLTFAWSVTGTPADGGGWSFDLALPRANQNELRLVLPKGWSVTAESALLYEPSASGGGDEADLLDDDGTAWRLETGGASRVRFSVRPPSNGRDESLLLYGETASYRFAPGLLDADISLALTVHERPVRSLALRVDPGLNVLSIRLGSQRLTWLEGAPDENGVRRLTVELPEPLRVGSHSLQIAATAEWPMDAKKAVPRIQVEHGVWQTGVATLTGTADVRVHAQSPGVARQGTASQTDTTTSGALRFEYYSGTARVEAIASRPKARLSVQSGLSLAVDANQATATLIADLSVASGSEGKRFEIAAVGSRRWLIESVETIPSDLLEDRTLTARGPDSQRLLVRLRRPLTNETPARLIVRARRQQQPDGEAVASDLLRFLTFADVTSERRLISIVATDPTLEPTLFSEAPLDRRDAATLGIYERSLLESTQGAILVETSAPESVGRLTLRRSEARYSAEIESAIDISQNAQANEVRLRIRPEVSSISTVLVRFAPKLRGVVEWSLDGEQPQAVVEKELAGVTTNADESLLLLQLPRPQSGPFQLIGRWSDPLADKTRIPLPSLPEATSQSGVVQVSASGGATARVQADGMTALPLSAASNRVAETILARYEYEPGRHAELVLLSRRTAERSPRLVVRQHTVDSTFSSDGSASHVAEYQLENLGADRFVLGAPADSKIESVEIDGRAAPTFNQSQSGGPIVVSLPNDVREPRVTLRYSSPAQVGSRWFTSEFRAPLPQVDLPCLYERWTVRLAPGLRCWDSPETHDEERSPRKAFDLFSRESWLRLWGDFGDAAAEEAATSDAGSNGLDHGWSVHEFALGNEPYAAVWVYKPVWVSICGISLALGVFALVAALPDRLGRTALWIAAGFTAAMFFLNPIPLVPLAWWGLAGVLIAYLWRGLKSPLAKVAERASQAGQAHGGESSMLTATRLVQPMLLIALLVGGVNALRGQDNVVARPVEPQQRVVFPVDKDQQPTGDYVYVSEKLYEVLHRVAPAQRSSNNPHWLIATASYNVSVTEDEDTNRPGGCDVVADYEIHTSADETKVQLPLGRGDVHLLASESLLDDVSLVPVWNETRDVLSIEIPNAGRHRLRLHFGLAFKRQNERYEVEFAIPKVPCGRAALIVDPDLGHGWIGGSSGAMEFTSEEGDVEINLPPTGQLQVAYIPHVGASTARAKVSASQRIWWRVRPGSVLADGRFDLVADGGELREIVLRTDSRVRFLPLDSDAGIVRQWTEEGPLNTVHLELAPPYPAEASLHARFLLVGAVGGGAFVPPLIEAVADRTDRYWEALSAPPGWEVEASAERLPAATFMQAWGGTAAPPDLAWDRAALGSLPAIQIRPAAKSPGARQLLEFSLGRDTGRLFYRADIEPVDQQLHQCSVAMPPELRVRTVLATVVEQPTPVEWWQASDGTLHARLPDAPASPLQLSIEADWELPATSKSFALPLVTLQGVGDSDYQVRVYRESNVSLRWDSRSGLMVVDDTLLGGYVPNRGRLEGHFIADAKPNRELKLRVDPNEPEITGRLVTVVRQVDLSWKTELHCDLLVQSGALDVLRFELPDHWSGPFEVEPATEHSVLTFPGQSRKQLVVRPQRPITDRLTLVVRGPLRTSASETIRAADVELLEAPLVERYVALPRGSTSAMTWETGGLQAIEADSSLLPAAIASQRYDVFRVIADRFEAVGRRSADDEQVRKPVVRLADVDVVWQHEPRYFGTVRFDLHPERLSDCTIVVPAGTQVAAVTLDGATAEVEPIGRRTLRVNLGRRQLPAQLEVAFVGHLPRSGPADEATTLRAPMLQDIPVERTQWTVRRTAHDRSIAPVDSALESALAQLDLERMDSALSALETAMDERNRPSQVDLGAWVARWLRQYDLSAARLQAAEFAGEAGTSITQAMEQLETRRAKLSLQGENLASNDSAPAASSRATIAGGPAFYVQAEGNLPAVSVRSEAIAAGDRTERRHALVGWAILGVAGLSLLGGRVRAFDWLRANGPLAVALAGLVVVALFPENPVGWLIVAAGALSAIFPRWRPAMLR